MMLGFILIIIKKDYHKSMMSFLAYILIINLDILKVKKNVGYFYLLYEIYKFNEKIVV